MAITANLVEINNTNLPGIKDYSVQRNKLYADAGRNMAGQLRTTFIGIFPKLLLEFRHLSRAEIATLCALLDLPSFTVKWYDAVSNTVKTGTYYAGDFEVTLFRKDNELHKPLKVNLVPFNKL